MQLGPAESDGPAIIKYVTMGIQAIVLSTLNLAITLAAVLFVANTLKERNELGGPNFDE